MPRAVLLLNNETKEIHVHLVLQAISQALRYSKVRQQIRNFETGLQIRHKIGYSKYPYLSLA